MNDIVPRFPLFIDLNGKDVLIVGGGSIAARRARVLLEFGAVVTVVAPEICDDLTGINGGVNFLREKYSAFDKKYSLVVAATNDREVNRLVGEHAKSAGISVSVADSKEESSFWFPAIANENGVIAGLVSVDGEHHGDVKIAAQTIRESLRETKMSKTVRIGTRESKLAVIQAELVASAIKKHHPEIEVELVKMKTTGDKILDKTLDKIGGKGLFVKELDDALKRGEVDLCVHSYKDMPADDDPDFPIVAVSPRENPRDVLILPKGTKEIAKDKPIGCASQRRQVQLNSIYEDQPIAPVRGNVLTRLEKLDRGEYSALVLAAAGIKRLDLWDRVDREFAPEEILPAGCQGVMAVQGRKGEDYSYLSEYNDKDAWDTSVAERAFVKRLGFGCCAPVGVYGEVDGENIRLRGMFANDDKKLLSGEITGKRSEAAELGTKLAEKMLADGEV